MIPSSPTILFATLIVADSGLEKTLFGAHIRGMRTRLPILLSVVLLAAAILLVLRDELHARGYSALHCHH
jgi:hypothetical protein